MLHSEEKLVKALSQVQMTFALKEPIHFSFTSEQPVFLVDRQVYLARPDLAAGKPLFGKIHPPSDALKKRLDPFLRDLKRTSLHDAAEKQGLAVLFQPPRHAWSAQIPQQISGLFAQAMQEALQKYAPLSSVMQVTNSYQFTALDPQPMQALLATAVAESLNSLLQAPSEEATREQVALCHREKVKALDTDLTLVLSIVSRQLAPLVGSAVEDLAEELTTLQEQTLDLGWEAKETVFLTLIEPKFRALTLLLGEMESEPGWPFPPFEALSICL